MRSTTISYDQTGEDFDESSIYDSTVLIGKKETLNLAKDPSRLSQIIGFETDSNVISATVDSIRGSSGSATTFVSKGKKGGTEDEQRAVHKLSFCTVPNKVSRNNHPMSVHTITKLVSSTCSDKSATTRIVLLGTSSSKNDDVLALASAVAKSFPLYSHKSNSDDDNDGDESNKKEREIHVSFLQEENLKVITDEKSLDVAKYVTEGVQLAGRLMDMPPEELTTDAYAEECRQICKDLGDDLVAYSEISGDELRTRGYGGLFGVGKAATCPPRLVIMEYTPEAPSTESVAFVGKGIVYDTGGLSLKSKTGMPGMKHDMGGSAGMLGAFYSAVKLRIPKKITLLLCLAENAIGPKAVRNDDILTLYSGKTVEINNSDAEGRLVLGDGVAHASKHIDGLDLIIDMATLTGAQLVATGKKHAGILANTAALEERAVSAGLRSGDLCFPLLYAPELLKQEFNSVVADMKNSVKDRGNAQTSCAGHFIESHLAKDYEGGWLHIDMAGPGSLNERGTGWGVGFLLSFLEV